MTAQNFLLKYINNNFPNSSILDLWCIWDNKAYKDWNYSMHRAINKINNNIIWVDINEEWIKYLNNKWYNIKYGNVENFNLEKKFDLILASNLIEHLTNLDWFLKSIKLHMNTNSELIISTPNAYSFMNFLAILFKGKRNSNEWHVFWQSIDTMEHLLNIYWLEIKKIYFFNSKINGWIINKFTIIINKLFSFIRKWFSTTIFFTIKLKNEK